MSVHGHWRSGAHYLNALLKLNFDHVDKTPRGHDFPGAWVKHPCFYTVRNFDDVSTSIWRLRERFGIKADSYEDFLDTKYKDMYHDYGDVTVGFYGKDVKVGSAGSMSKLDYTPFEYWMKHTNAWADYPGVYQVDYDLLRQNFQEEMRKIAAYLNKPTDGRFEDIREAQGWHK